MPSTALRRRQLRQARCAQTAANGGVAPTSVHNAWTYKSWGCRCNRCRKAEIAAQLQQRRTAQARTAARGGIAPEGVTHGLSASKYYKCRCEVCMSASRAELASRRASCAGKEPPRHGISGYNHYACRCKVCTDACAAVSRERRRRAKAAAG